MKYTSFKTPLENLYLNKHEAITKEFKEFLKDLKISINSIVKIDCYISSSETEELKTAQETLLSTLKSVFKKAPAHSLLPQDIIPSSKQATFNIQLNNDTDVTIEYKVFQKHPYTVVQANGEKLIYSGGIEFNLDNDSLRNIQLAYDFAEQLLDHEEMHFGHIAYQNNYLKNIDSLVVDPRSEWTPYQALNSIKTFYYDPTLFKNGYPLQNDRNQNAGNCLIDFVACQKEAFPSAQFLSNNNDETSLVYIPAIKQCIYKGLSSEANTASAQLKAIKNEFDTACSNAPLKLTNCFDELKVYLSDEIDIESIKNVVNDLFETDKLTILNTKHPNPQTLISIEGLMNVIA